MYIISLCLSLALPHGACTLSATETRPYVHSEGFLMYIKARRDARTGLSPVETSDVLENCKPETWHYSNVPTLPGMMP